MLPLLLAIILSVLHSLPRHHVRPEFTPFNAHHPRGLMIGYGIGVTCIAHKISRNMRSLCASSLIPRCLRCGANLESRSLTVSARASAIHTDNQGYHSDYQGNHPNNRLRQTLLARYAEKFHKPGDLDCCVGGADQCLKVGQRGGRPPPVSRGTPDYVVHLASFTDP
jgi:hypothetical protein